MAMQLTQIISDSNQTDLEVVPADFNTLLGLLQRRIDIEADEYNSVVDTLAETQDELSTSQLKNNLMAAERAELKAKVESLTAGNKLLMEKTREQEAKLRSGGDQLEKAVRVEVLLKQKVEQLEVAMTLKVRELEGKVKDLKANGDPVKLLAQNKTLREKNEALTATNSRLQQQINKFNQELKDLAKYGGEYHYLPSYSSVDGENVYIHPKVIKVVEAGELHTKVALTYWRKEGVGRVITWDGEQLHFASFNHKEVDADMAPSQEVVDFCQNWFLKNVVVHGRVQNMASNFRLKGTK